MERKGIMSSDIQNYSRIPVGQAKDLTGKKFGKLTVLYRTPTNPNLSYKGATWVCQCECGTIKAINSQHLIKGNIISCGCENRKRASERMLKYNLAHQTIKIGDRFGKLTVLEGPFLKKRKDGRKREAYYLCQCDCGSAPIEVLGNSLQTGNTKSCGCLMSKGEFAIKELLEKNNITFKQEYSFSDLRNPKTNCLLRFDFAIFSQEKDLEFLIEYDGRQHYQGPDTLVWSSYQSQTRQEALEEIHFRDALKNKYCQENNLILKRIPYWISLKQLTIEDIYSDKYNVK